MRREGLPATRIKGQLRFKKGMEDRGWKRE